MGILQAQPRYGKRNDGRNRNPNPLPPKREADLPEPRKRKAEKSQRKAKHRAARACPRKTAHGKRKDNAAHDPERPPPNEEKDARERQNCDFAVEHRRSVWIRIWEPKTSASLPLAVELPVNRTFRARRNRHKRLQYRRLLLGKNRTWRLVVEGNRLRTLTGEAHESAAFEEIRDSSSLHIRPRLDRHCILSEAPLPSSDAGERAGPGIYPLELARRPVRLAHPVDEAVFRRNVHPESLLGIFFGIEAKRICRRPGHHRQDGKQKRLGDREPHSPSSGTDASFQSRSIWTARMSKGSDSVHVELTL